MDYRKIIAAGAALAGAAGTVAGILAAKKLGAKAPAAKAEKAAAPAAKAAIPAANLATGTYSFVSGFKDSKTYDLTVDYDKEKFSFAVISEEFLVPTGDSHAAVMYGEDFNAQIEYASYYYGENFEAMSKAAAEKFKGFENVSYGANKGIKYYDGEGIVLCFPACDDEYSYVQISVMCTKDSDLDYTQLAGCKDLSNILGSMKIISK